MGWGWDRTIAGGLLTPYQKKVRISLKELFEYEVSEHLEGVFDAFINQHSELGFDRDITAIRFLAVVINSLEDNSLETQELVYRKNFLVLGCLSYLKDRQLRQMSLREIGDSFIEASTGILPEWIINQCWDETLEDSWIVVFLGGFKKYYAGREESEQKITDYFADLKRE
tara:strand:+ start:350 stop:859 length:510 start_codon:yes stop_codon:yes gene_type:complete